MKIKDIKKNSSQNQNYKLFPKVIGNYKPKSLFQHNNYAESWIITVSTMFPISLVNSHSKHYC